MVTATTTVASIIITPTAMSLRVKKSGKSGKLKYLSRFFQQADAPRVILLQGIVIILLVGTGLLHFRSAFFAQLSQNQGGNIASFSQSLSHPGALANMARVDHLRNADLASAIILYKKALENFVLHIPSWFGIIEVLNDNGQEREAAAALQFVHSQFNDNEDITWSKTLLASALDQEEILSESLIWLASNAPHKKKDVFALAVLSWDDPDVLLNKFGKDFYVNILQEYIINDEFDKTLRVWNKIVQSGSIEQPAAIQYINYLISQNAFSLATKAWAEIIGSNQPLLYNGDFKKPLLGSGFGWRMSKPKGMSSETGTYDSGLQISFDGTENVSFQLSQTVPLNPGKYIFNGSIETDGLTTDQLPYWQIQGVQCIGLNKKSQMALPNQHATNFEIPFIMPGDCELIRLSLIRQKSFHFDNKIAGKVAINNLYIQLDNTASTLPRQPSTNLSDENTEIQKSPPGTKTNISINNLLIKP